MPSCTCEEDGLEQRTCSFCRSEKGKGSSGTLSDYARSQDSEERHSEFSGKFLIGLVIQIMY